MIESVIVAGLVIAIVEVIKKYTNLPEVLYFVPVMILATGLNAGNAYFFGEGIMTIKDAVVEGIKLGAQIAGIYGLGKPFIQTILNQE